MESVSPDWLPRAKLPAVQVKITNKYIVQQALQALKISVCETTTRDFLSDEIIASISFELPPHGDCPFTRKEKFYGEPCKAINEALESAHESALRYLQKADIVIIDDANLNELMECRRSLMRAKSWADGFEMKCDSQKAELAAMATHIELISSGAPLPSAAKSEKKQDILLWHATSPPYKNVIVPDQIHPGQVTPVHDTVISEKFAAVTSKDLHAIHPDGTSNSGQDGVAPTVARRSLFPDH